MTGRGPFLFLVVLLILCGISITAFRHNEYRIPIWPGTQQTVWQVEARIVFQTSGDNTQVYLTLPPEQSGFRVLNETGASSGFGFVMETGAQQRRAHWSKRSAVGEQTLFYKLELVSDPAYQVADTPPDAVPNTAWDEPYDTAVSQVLSGLLPITADSATLANQLIAAMNTVPLSQNLSLLLDRYSRPELLAAMLNTAGINARRVQVLELEDGRRRQSLRDYVQVWQTDGWHLFNPQSGPVHGGGNLLLWQTDTPAVLEVLGGTRSRVGFSMISQTRPVLSLAKEAQDGFQLSLYSLPIAEQGMFKLIMLLPVGALVVVFMRVVVGLKTSGTFMPILIALAFLQTELVPGVISLLIIVALGLMLRSYLSALNLLLVARIATLVIVVIFMISLFSVISYELGLMGGLTISFFPMIILAWTIERMSILWEEEGPREVLVQGGGSLIVAILAYSLMNLEWIRHLAFNFPELHLLVLALILMLGRYTGYRVLELHRFAPFKSIS